MINKYLLISFWRENKKSFIAVFILGLLYTLPIVMADRHFIDDLGRSTQGYYNWSGNGRPLADYIMILFNFGGIDIDISPLPLFTSLMLYSVASVSYVRSISVNASSPIITIAALGALVNPFYLENLSYKFDVLPMTVSMSLLLIAFIPTSSMIIRMILGVILVVSSLSNYQATIGVFIALSAIEFIKNAHLNSGKDLNVSCAFYMAFQRVLQLGISYIIYSKIIQPFFIPTTNGYTIKHSELVSFDEAGFNIVKRNASIFLDRMGAYFSSVPSWIVYFCAISIVISSIVISLRVIKKITTLNVLAAVVVLLTPAFVLFFSIAHLMILSVPITDPRVCISFSATTLMVTSIHLIHGKYTKILTLISLLFVLFSFVYAYAFGNALKELNDYENFITASIANDIKSIDPDARLKIQTIGYMDYPQQTKLTISKYPAMRFLLPRYLNDDWYWAFFQMGRFGVNNHRARLSESDVKKRLSSDEVINKGTYGIIVDGDVLIVHLKGKK